MANEHQASPILPPSAQLDRAAELLRTGGIVAFPTETVYGLGADAADEQAVLRIFSSKGRPADHPLIVHLADIAQLDQWVYPVSNSVYRLAERFWPGPLTLILHKQPWVSDLVTGGQKTIGVRIPSHPVALEMLKKFGGGVAAPSANRFGKISPTTAEHVRQELGDKPDMILDGGPCQVGLESTILDLSGEQPLLLRPGSITAQLLAETLNRNILFPGNAAKTRAPGTLPSHYAPTAPLYLVSAGHFTTTAAALPGSGNALISIKRYHGAQFAGFRHIRMPDEPSEYARHLYATLRMLDETAPTGIIVEMPPDTPAWHAVRDRLQRAAAATGAISGNSAQTIMQAKDPSDEH